MNKALPKGWKMVKFEDIGIHISEKIAPSDTDLDIYIGLEHLDSESLRIKRWGSPSDVIGEKLRVRPGEVIFGKRRAYQRKLAIAEFDCICSAHAMVLKAKEENVVKDFFPFFLQSDLFMERALEISVGSLSPTINWKTLKVQEFPLPPLAEQKRSAQVLWAVENAIWKTEDAIANSIMCRNVIFDKLSKKGKKVKLGTCIKERGEVSLPPHQIGQYVGLEQMESGSHSVKGYLDSSTVKSNCSVFHPGDLLYGKLRPNLDKAAIADIDGICSTEILVLQPTESIETDYLILIFHSKKFVQYNAHIAYGTKMPRTSMELISDHEICPPSNAEQKRNLKLVQSYLRNESIMRQHIEQTKCMKEYLINILLIHGSGFGGDA